MTTRAPHRHVDHHSFADRPDGALAAGVVVLLAVVLAVIFLAFALPAARGAGPGASWPPA